MGRSVRGKDRLRAVFESVVVGLLLFSVVVSTLAGAEAALLFTVLVAWKNTLDAGCAFMLISLGVVVVVWVARNGSLPW
jgi:Kef-type K+ transport system membrane component KefB